MGMSIVNSYKKQFIALFTILIILFSTSAFVIYNQVDSTVKEESLSKLTTIRDSLNIYITDYFKGVESSVLAFSENSEVLSNFYALKKAYIESNSSKIRSDFVENNPFNLMNRDNLFKTRDGGAYSDIHHKVHGEFQKLLNRYKFYDLLLIDTDGEVIYTTKKEVDFAKNLHKGEFSYTNFAKSFDRAINLKERGSVIFSDFDNYYPTANRESSFLLTPLFDKGEIVGIFAVQLSIDKIIDTMLLNSSGFGDSGEAYLVGEDHYMRSDSRFIRDINRERRRPLQTTVGVIKVDTSSVRKALVGESGESIITDYRGVKVLSSYSPIKIFDQNWAIIVEIDSKEAVENIESSLMKTLFIIVLLIALSILFLSYLFLKTVFRPLEKSRNEISNSVKRKSRQLENSLAFLEEYKRAIDRSAIISKANKSGKITYVNSLFSEISGYKKDELIGKSHNIIRHPDMPKEVFSDLWNTISHKRVWKGIVKNRKKDGSDYYVNSTIIPMLDEKGEIREYISIRTDITELINKKQELLKQTTDNLTKLPNREKLYSDLISLKQVTLIIIKLDQYTEIVDFYGIASAEELIINAVEMINRQLLKGSKLYRVDSSEFAVLYQSKIMESELNEWIEALIRDFDHNFISTNKHSFSVSVSIGIAQGEGKEQLFNESKTALRKAIESDKRYIPLRELQAVKDEYQNNIEMTSKIKSAIAEDRVIIFAQQIFSNYSDPISKYEVLVRIKDGDKIISPFHFLDIAKKARLYTTITKIVIDKSFKEFSDRDDDFSVNLTMEDILDVAIVDYLKRKIIEHRVGEQLIIEIVESEGVQDFEAVSRFITDLKRLGCRVAIDDFGTGYSNFDYLMRLDIDFIKIDGSIIKSIDKDRDAQLLVEMIVKFAQEKKIKTVAEFVASREILNTVKELKVDYSQGFLLAEPKIV